METMIYCRFAYVYIYIANTKTPGKVRFLGTAQIGSDFANILQCFGSITSTHVIVRYRPPLPVVVDSWSRSRPGVVALVTAIGATAGRGGQTVATQVCENDHRHA
jgi:hypothetical protein